MHEIASGRESAAVGCSEWRQQEQRKKGARGSAAVKSPQNHIHVRLSLEMPVEGAYKRMQQLRHELPLTDDHVH
jgi:hypothetical protein